MTNRSTLPLEAKHIAAPCGFEGRIGRLAFLGWHAAAAIYTLPLVALAAVTARLVGVEIAAVLAAVPVVWAVLVLHVRRLHDMDFSGSHALWISALVVAASQTDGAAESVLRLANYGVVTWVCLMPGSPGPNRFGTAPEPLPTPPSTAGASNDGGESPKG